MLDIFLYAGRAIMPLLLMMALGCGLRRVGRWSDDFYRQLNGFCFHVLLPVQLFLNVYAIEDLSVLNWRLLGFIVACIVGAAGLGVAAAPLFARDRGQRAVIAQATFRANQVIMGIPLASALGGEEALIFASLVTSVCVPVFNVLAVVVQRGKKPVLAGRAAPHFPEPPDPGRSGGLCGGAAAADGAVGVRPAADPALRL